MPKNFHESFAEGEIKPPSECGTGLVFATVALIVAFLWRNSPTVLWLALSVPVMLAIVSLIAPVLLKPLNMLWFRFGLLLHWVVNPSLVFAVFALVFLPAGAIMRLWHDPLMTRRARDGSRYLNASRLRQRWLDVRAIEGLANQFHFIRELVFPPPRYMRSAYPQRKPG